MSNPVFIVSNQDESKKIVIRFFESKTADFELENKIFDVASKNGFCPKAIDTDNSTFRVEEFFPGRPFKNHELKDPKVQKACAELLYEFNHDKDLISILPQDTPPKSLEYIAEKEKGWYWKALREVI